MIILEGVAKHHTAKCEITKNGYIANNILFMITKNRDAIIKVKESILPNQLHNKEAKYPLLERALFEWMENLRSKNKANDDNVLKAKAEAFTEKFKDSNG